MKCEASDNGLKCGKVAIYKIVDLECGIEYGDFTSFWVCEECIGFFIKRNEDNPHYILLFVKDKKTNKEVRE